MSNKVHTLHQLLKFCTVLPSPFTSKASCQEFVESSDCDTVGAQLQNVLDAEHWTGSALRSVLLQWTHLFGGMTHTRNDSAITSHRIPQNCFPEWTSGTLAQYWSRIHSAIDNCTIWSELPPLFLLSMKAAPVPAAAKSALPLKVPLVVPFYDLMRLNAVKGCTRHALVAVILRNPQRSCRWVLKLKWSQNALRVVVPLHPFNETSNRAATAVASGHPLESRLPPTPCGPVTVQVQDGQVCLWASQDLHVEGMLYADTDNVWEQFDVPDHIKVIPGLVRNFVRRTPATKPQSHMGASPTPTGMKMISFSTASFDMGHAPEQPMECIQHDEYADERAIPSMRDAYHPILVQGWEQLRTACAARVPNVPHIANICAGLLQLEEAIWQHVSTQQRQEAIAQMLTRTGDLRESVRRKYENKQLSDSDERLQSTICKFSDSAVAAAGKAKTSPQGSAQPKAHKVSCEWNLARYLAPFQSPNRLKSPPIHSPTVVSYRFTRSAHCKLWYPLPQPCLVLSGPLHILHPEWRSVVTNVNCDLRAVVQVQDIWEEYHYTIVYTVGGKCGGVNMVADIIMRSLQLTDSSNDSVGSRSVAVRTVRPPTTISSFGLDTIHPYSVILADPVGLVGAAGRRRFESSLTGSVPVKPSGSFFIPQPVLAQQYQRTQATLDGSLLSELAPADHILLPLAVVLFFPTTGPFAASLASSMRRRRKLSTFVDTFLEHVRWLRTHTFRDACCVACAAKLGCRASPGSPPEHAKSTEGSVYSRGVRNISFESKDTAPHTSSSSSSSAPSSSSAVPSRDALSDIEQLSLEQIDSLRDLIRTSKADPVCMQSSLLDLLTRVLEHIHDTEQKESQSSSSSVSGHSNSSEVGSSSSQSGSITVPTAPTLPPPSVLEDASDMCSSLDGDDYSQSSSQMYFVPAPSEDSSPETSVSFGSDDELDDAPMRKVLPSELHRKQQLAKKITRTFQESGPVSVPVGYGIPVFPPNHDIVRKQPSFMRAAQEIRKRLQWGETHRHRLTQPVHDASDFWLVLHGPLGTGRRQLVRDTLLERPTVTQVWKSLTVTESAPTEQGNSQASDPLSVSSTSSVSLDHDIQSLTDLSVMLLGEGRLPALVLDASGSKKKLSELMLWQFMRWHGLVLIICDTKLADLNKLQHFNLHVMDFKLSRLPAKDAVDMLLELTEDPDSHTNVPTASASSAASSSNTVARSSAADEDVSMLPTNDTTASATGQATDAANTGSHDYDESMAPPPRTRRQEHKAALDKLVESLLMCPVRIRLTAGLLNEKTREHNQAQPSKSRSFGELLAAVREILKRDYHDPANAASLDDEDKWFVSRYEKEVFTPFSVARMHIESIKLLYRRFRYTLMLQCDLVYPAVAFFNGSIEKNLAKNLTMYTFTSAAARRAVERVYMDFKNNPNARRSPMKGRSVDQMHSVPPHIEYKRYACSDHQKKGCLESLDCFLSIVFEDFYHTCLRLGLANDSVQEASRTVFSVSPLVRDHVRVKQAAKGAGVVRCNCSEVRWDHPVNTLEQSQLPAFANFNASSPHAEQKKPTNQYPDCPLFSFHEQSFHTGRLRLYQVFARELSRFGPIASMIKNVCSPHEPHIIRLNRLINRFVWPLFIHVREIMDSPSCADITESGELREFLPVVLQTVRWYRRFDGYRCKELIDFVERRECRPFLQELVERVERVASSTDTEMTDDTKVSSGDQKATSHLLDDTQRLLSEYALNKAKADRFDKPTSPHRRSSGGTWLAPVTQSTSVTASSVVTSSVVTSSVVTSSSGLSPWQELCACPTPLAAAEWILGFYKPRLRSLRDEFYWSYQMMRLRCAQLQSMGRDRSQTLQATESTWKEWRVEEELTRMENSLAVRTDREQVKHLLLLVRLQRFRWLWAKSDVFMRYGQHKRAEKVLKQAKSTWSQLREFGVDGHHLEYRKLRLKLFYVQRVARMEAAAGSRLQVESGSHLMRAQFRLTLNMRYLLESMVWFLDKCADEYAAQVVFEDDVDMEEDNAVQEEEEKKGSNASSADIHTQLLCRLEFMEKDAQELVLVTSDSEPGASPGEQRPAVYLELAVRRLVMSFRAMRGQAHNMDSASLQRCDKLFAQLQASPSFARCAGAYERAVLYIVQGQFGKALQLLEKDAGLHVRRHQDILVALKRQRAISSSLEDIEWDQWAKWAFPLMAVPTPKYEQTLLLQLVWHVASLGELAQSSWEDAPSVAYVHCNLLRTLDDPEILFHRAHDMVGHVLPDVSVDTGKEDEWRRCWPALRSRLHKDDVRAAIGFHCPRFCDVSTLWKLRTITSETPDVASVVAGKRNRCQPEARQSKRRK